jgi:hypothetical protein
MRKLFAILFVLVSFAATAQTTTPAASTSATPVKSSQIDKPFKVTIAGGYASPAQIPDNSDLSKAGFVYSIEPQYELSKNLEVGFRFEQAFIQRPEALDKDLFYTSKAKSIMSGILTANYVLNTSTGLKPFVGLGAGIYYADPSQQTYQSAGSSVVTYPLPATVLFGGMARVGVKYGIVHVEANYNLVSDTSVTNAGSRLTLTAKNTYFSLKAGLTIGGSR